ncbi:MAG: alpha/beta fold hydrolase [Nitriliruptoraceae bacterium]
MRLMVASPSTPVSRSPLRRFLEARGTLGGIDVLHLDARMRTRDGVDLAAAYIPRHGGGSAAASDAAILLVHGFGASGRKPSYARLAAALATYAPVLALDLRGHGHSGGVCTLGDREVLDVEAALGWLAGIGHHTLVAIGASMGASAVLGAAASGIDLAGVVSISGPATFREVVPPGPLRQLQDVWYSPVRRAALRAGLRIRLAAPSRWSFPPDPEVAAGRIRAPLLVIHGVDDAYFPVDDARRLVAAAGGATSLWLAGPGFGHAEDGFSDAFATALGAAVSMVLTTGRFPHTTEPRAF